MFCHNLTILYGSQTGTAQNVAERLWREAKKYNLVCLLSSMDDFKIQNLIYERLVVFICSTTGQGDQPDNMKKFWRFLLKKNLPSNSLQILKFAVLGLGDSSYKKFNFAAKMLFRRLLQLNAKPFIDPCYADEQHDLGIYAVIDPWILKLWTEIAKLIPNLEISLYNNDQFFYPTRWHVSIVDTQVDLDYLRNEDIFETNSSEVLCIENERVTCVNHFQDSRLIKFTLQNLSYDPGDILKIKPKNSITAVKQFFSLFCNKEDNIDENAAIVVEKKYDDMPVPYFFKYPIKLKQIVEEYWDLNAVPGHHVFQLLSNFTDNDLERRKLIEFCSTEGQQDLYNYCNRPKRTILEVLADFPNATAKIPFEYLFELFQPIRHRSFSIASSMKVHKNEIHILVAVVKFKTNLKIPRIGLCSNWLASLKPGEKVVVLLRPGTFSFPKKEASVIMVGPGTGVAPFRSYIHENSICKYFNTNYLFFGCRNKNSDFYFEDEWSSLIQKGVIKLFTAFSRDQKEKIYVQNVIENNSLAIWNALNKENPYIFVAGNSKNMPDSVRKAFILCYVKHSKKDEKFAENFIEDMERRGHYQTETWS